MSTPTPTPAQAPDYIRTDDGATMREVVPGEFVNLAILQGWGFKQPEPTVGKTKLTIRNSDLGML